MSLCMDYWAACLLYECHYWWFNHAEIVVAPGHKMAQYISVWDALTSGALWQPLKVALKNTAMLPTAVENGKRLKNTIIMEMKF